MDCRLPVFSVHGIFFFLARILERLPFPPPGDIPHGGFEPAPLVSAELQGDFLITGPSGKPQKSVMSVPAMFLRRAESLELLRVGFGELAQNPAGPAAEASFSRLEMKRSELWERSNFWTKLNLNQSQLYTFQPLNQYISFNVCQFGCFFFFFVTCKLRSPSWC